MPPAERRRPFRICSSGAGDAERKRAAAKRPSEWHPGFDPSSLPWTGSDSAVAVYEFEPLADRHQPDPVARNGALRIEAHTAIDDLQTNLCVGAAHRHPDLARAGMDDRVDGCFL